MFLTERQLQGIMRQATMATIAEWTPALRSAMAEFEINTKARAAGFLASVANESGELTRFQELGYSNTPNDHIVRTFGRRAPQPAELVLWKTMGRQAFDELFFNRVYDDRRVNIGLGNDRDGDGYKYRGLGPLQLTGKANARWIGLLIGVDLVAKPELLLDPVIGARAAAAYWKAVGNNERLDAGNFLGALVKMNPGLPDFSPHEAFHRRAVAVLAKEAKETPATVTEAAKQVVTGKTGAAAVVAAGATGLSVADAVVKINEVQAGATAAKGLFSIIGVPADYTPIVFGTLALVGIGLFMWRYGFKLLRGEAQSS